MPSDAVADFFDKRFVARVVFVFECDEPNVFFNCKCWAAALDPVFLADKRFDTLKLGKVTNPCNCFTGGTKVQTNEGEKNIELVPKAIAREMIICGIK